jgi:hypothetical protein
MHGTAITPGCPGCDDYVDDLEIARIVAERDKPCDHQWIERDIGVSECDVCASLLFREGCDRETMERWLLDGGVA